MKTKYLQVTVWAKAPEGESPAIRSVKGLALLTNGTAEQAEQKAIETVKAGYSQTFPDTVFSFTATSSVVDYQFCITDDYLPAKQAKKATKKEPATTEQDITEQGK